MRAGKSPPIRSLFVSSPSRPETLPRRLHLGPRPASSVRWARRRWCSDLATSGRLITAVNSSRFPSWSAVRESSQKQATTFVDAADHTPEGYDLAPRALASAREL